MKVRRRRSIRMLILALLLMMLPIFALPVHADNFLGDVARDSQGSVERAGDAVGNAMNHTSDAVGNTVGEIFDDARDGRVRDSDGFIGNERAEITRSADEEQGISNAWLGWVIAIVVTAVIVTMIVILIPRKRED